MKILIAVIAGAAATVAAWSTPVQADGEWLRADRRPCDVVCRQGGGRPVISGEHVVNGRRTGDRFYVCSAEINGFRPGLNLRPNWQDVCMVPYGGQELRMSNYLCLCE